MKFFESEIVQEELEEINQLQQELYGKMMNMQSLSREERVDHIDNLKLLLEKQKENIELDKIKLNFLLVKILVI